MMGGQDCTRCIHYHPRGWCHVLPDWEMVRAVRCMWYRERWPGEEGERLLRGFVEEAALEE